MAWCLIFKLILLIDGRGISNEIALVKLAPNLIDDKSALVQEWLGVVGKHVIAWTNVGRNLWRLMALLSHNELRNHQQLKKPTNHEA